MSSAKLLILIVKILFITTTTTTTTIAQNQDGIFVYDVADSATEWRLIAKAEEIRRNATMWGVFRGMRTWLKVDEPKESLKELIWRPIKGLFVSEKNWQDRTLIETTDGRPRRTWMVNFTRFIDDLANATRGRIRIVDGQLFFRAVQVEDTGIYSCLVINAQQGIVVHHFSLVVRHFENGWFDFENPNVLFKWSLVAAVVVFSAVAALDFANFNKRRDRAFASRMEATFNSLKVNRLFEERNRMAARFAAANVRMEGKPQGIKRG